MNNQDYEKLAKDIIENAFYSNQNPRGKISDERQYAELILRKLINWDSNKNLTLGDTKVHSEIRAKFDQNFADFVIDTVEIIRDPGNKSTHTKERGDFTSQDLDVVTDAVFALLASLFINYFNQYQFGSKPEIMYSFSFLPPIVRYKVLTYLYEQDAANIAVIDKLVLAILKYKSKEDAQKWVEDRKAELMDKKAITTEAYEQAKRERGEAFADKLRNSTPIMYDHCLKKIKDVAQQIEKNGGLLYPDFETAKKYYLEKGILQGTEPEIVAFNDLMEFVYLGRREAKDVEVKPPLLTVNIEPPSFDDALDVMTMDGLVASREEESQ